MNVHRGRSATVTIAAVLVLAGLVFPGLAPASAAAGLDGPCAAPLFSDQVRAQVALSRQPLAFAAAARVNGQTLKDFTHAAQDPTLWLDECGHGLYIEPSLSETAQHTEEALSATAEVPAVGQAAVPAATALQPLANTFLLESRPGSAKTIFLDFAGDTITNTGWNGTYGSTLTMGTYSETAPADTNYTNSELTNIQKIWQIVAEDYAPYDVNVTTRNFGVDAIERTNDADLVYGTRVLITDGGAIYNSCGCGGIAYINVFNYTNPYHMYYQPAFVFTNGVGTGPKNLGEAASHEAGHNFGMYHDGTTTGSSYYLGSSPWAPIMGAGYYRPVSQWSKGEYLYANNTADDLWQISTGAPYRADDHGDTTAGGTALSAGTPINGVIGTSTDVDAFTFTGSGSTTVSVTVADYANLDAQLQIADSSGTIIATANPAVSEVSASVANGLSASWTATLPSTPASYTAFVDGIGSGNPLTAGLYSDYASLGNYQIALTTAVVGTPLSATATNPATATVGTAYTAANPVTATGGTSPYSYSASGMPPGLTMSSSTGGISGNPTTSGTYNVTVTVTDSASASTTASFTMTVNAAVPALVISTSTPASATVGVAYSATPVSASGGTSPYTFSATGLPAGLTMSTAGRVSGTPTKAGTFTVTATVTDAAARRTSGTFTLVVNPALAFTTSATLPSATFNRAYSTTIAITGGKGLYSWSRTSGSLPTGMTLTVAADGKSATVSGTGTVKAKYTFTLAVTDGNGTTVSRTFTITVK